VIKSFKDEKTRTIFQRRFSPELPPSMHQVALRKLRMLHNAENINDVRVPPGNRLEKLSGRRAGQYSMRINEKWRICFEWSEGNAYNVEIVDYH
jgi:proteic killer suppression protein